MMDSHPQTKFIRQARERILLKQRADELMHETQLLARAEIKQVGEDPRSLGP